MPREIADAAGAVAAADGAGGAVKVKRAMFPSSLRASADRAYNSNCDPVSPAIRAQPKSLAKNPISSRPRK